VDELRRKSAFEIRKSWGLRLKRDREIFEVIEGKEKENGYGCE
jgi:hypothetical protein